MKKLCVKNNWESFEYYIDDERIDPKKIKTVIINGLEHECYIRESVVPYTDWGHTYYSNRETLYTIIKDSTGMKFEVELTGMIQNGNVFVRW